MGGPWLSSQQGQQTTLSRNNQLIVNQHVELATWTSLDNGIGSIAISNGSSVTRYFPNIRLSGWTMNNLYNHNSKPQLKNGKIEKTIDWQDLKWNTAFVTRRKRPQNQRTRYWVDWRTTRKKNCRPYKRRDSPLYTNRFCSVRLKAIYPYPKFTNSYFRHTFANIKNSKFLGPCAV